MTTPLSGKKIFGPGRPFLISNTANATPMRPLVVQDQSITFKREVKGISGENQLAADISSGSMDVTGKVTFGGSNARLFADQLFGDVGTAGSQINESDLELCSVTSHSCTVTQSATFTTDLGVINATTGAHYVAVASAPALGQYSYAAGVYTFNASDTISSARISYLYTVSSGGELVTMANQPQGKVGASSAVMVFPWQNQTGAVEQDVLTLNLCLITDHELSTKQAEYGKPTFSFMAGCDALGNLGTFSFAEAA